MNPDPQAMEKTIDYTWTVIHSGSRQLGKAICDYHQAVARDQLKKLTEGDYEEKIKEIRKSTKNPKNIPAKIAELRREIGLVTGVNTKGLETLTGKAMYEYLYDMVFAQIYASWNRLMMQARIHDVLGKPQVLEQVETIHNYISMDDLIIRKGAVASYSGEKLIIPFNMKDGIWICRGMSNIRWNNSAPHGAGRKMSRSKAKESLDIAKVKEQMKNADVYSSHIPLDEAPDAYKDTATIKRLLNRTASVIEEVKPFMNLKA